ncbi:hypothetical protein OF829_05180 [Sphingomonas sp. LB-2]|uniref:carbohydrate binding domain-containing protein n=1 Tax=Sphingomonas caeni TaxID=2984949 RepID=UPI002232C008|nr:carbohydrate binding domain-containing protein [Sphingomonas caeni]MCW3846622.1 hypothetical protein [Sphingomonas caeni]
MSLRIALALGLLAAPVAAIAALPQQQSDDAAARQIVNNPDPSTFTIYGVNPTPKSKRDDTVQGGRSLAVSVTGSGTPYAVGIGSPILQDIKAGDHLVLMFYAKLVKAEPGVTTATINAQVQLSSAPYTTIFAKPFEITPEWKLFQVAGVADKDYAKGTIGATFHVNTGKQTVALGLVAVLDTDKK